MPVLSGTLPPDAAPSLNIVDAYCVLRFSGLGATAQHVWVDSVPEGTPERVALDALRSHSAISAAIRSRFSGATVQPVPEVDELYWAVSPIGAVGSDRALVDCHYDAPFALLPSGGAVFYRVIVACNANDAVTTSFPNDNKRGMRVTMTTGDFHGLDYNRDWHCVEGAIPPGRHRVLLKLHYLVIPQGTLSRAMAPIVRWCNVTWTHGSRELMQRSAAPSNPLEYAAAAVVTGSRVVFNHTALVGAAVLVAVLALLVVTVPRVHVKADAAIAVIRKALTRRSRSARPRG